MSEADEIALRKEQLEAAIQAQLDRNKAIQAGEAEEAVPVGASDFQRQQRKKRAARRRQEELLEALEEVDDSLLGTKIPETDDTPDTPETEDETNQRRRIDEALAGFGE